MSEEGLAVVPSIKVSCPKHSRGQQSPRGERREGMFSLPDFSGFVCLFEAFLQGCVKHRGLAHSSDKDSQEITV